MQPPASSSVVSFQQVRAKRRAVTPVRRRITVPEDRLEEPTIIAVGDTVRCPDGAVGRVAYFHAEHHCVVSLGGTHCGIQRVEQINELLLVEEA